MQAAVYGHMDVVRFLSDLTDPNLTEMLEDGCQYGNPEIVQYLFSERNATIQMIGKFACREGHSPIVELLLSMGADVHHNDDAALSDAITGGHLEIVKMLVQHGATIKDEALSTAIWKDDLVMVQYLVQNGADINGSTSHGGNMLCLAGSFKRTEIRSYLKSKGAYYRGPPGP